jgi:hypothetical protein
VRWHTGATEEITATRRQPDRTPAGAVELARRLGGVLSDEQLAETHCDYDRWLASRYVADLARGERLRRLQ